MLTIEIIWGECGEENVLKTSAKRQRKKIMDNVNDSNCVILSQLFKNGFKNMIKS